MQRSKFSTKEAASMGACGYTNVSSIHAIHTVKKKDQNNHRYIALVGTYIGGYGVDMDEDGGKTGIGVRSEDGKTERMQSVWNGIQKTEKNRSIFFTGHNIKDSSQTLLDSCCNMNTNKIPLEELPPRRMERIL